MKVRNIVINLPISQIYSHPDNPRKNLGDIEELTESVKKNGLMQNLTVMPGHWMSKEEYVRMAKREGVSKIDAEGSYTGEEWSNEGYTLLIGHRRCAAARKAGLDKVPCRIVEEVSKNEQVGIMLEENMQRNDLTIVEQAEGFQMMLDLGETVETLSEKTGFSKSTIYHRTHLAKLDKETLKKVEEDDSYQLNLKDLYELEKVADVSKRNEILEKAKSSQNLKWYVENAVKEQKQEKVQQSILELFAKHNIPEGPEQAKESWRNNWEVLQEFTWDKEPELKIELTDDVVWVKKWNSHQLVREKVQQATEEAKEDNTANRKNEIKDELEHINDSIKESINDFKQMIIKDKVELGKDINKIWKAMLKIDTAVDLDYLLEALNGEIPNVDEYPDEYNAAVEEALNMPLEKQLLIFMIYAFPTYIFSKWNVRTHENGVFLLKIGLDVLKDYGFELSEEQNSFLEGKHPLFLEYEKLMETA